MEKLKATHKIVVWSDETNHLYGMSWAIPFEIAVETCATWVKNFPTDIVMLVEVEDD